MNFVRKERRLILNSFELFDIYRKYERVIQFEQSQSIEMKDLGSWSELSDFNFRFNDFSRHKPSSDGGSEV
jgi:hypothetical protein